MGKLLLFILIAIVIYLLLRARRPARGEAAAPQASPEAMVECAHCGLHVPLGESLEAAGRRYCSEEHRRLGTGGSSR